MYLGLKKKDGFKTITQKKYTKNLELIDLFQKTQYILHLDYYHPETLKRYTVAIGYNKGGYQVIPNSEIKDIGK